MSELVYPETEVVSGWEEEGSVDSVVILSTTPYDPDLYIHPGDEPSVAGIWSIGGFTLPAGHFIARWRVAVTIWYTMTGALIGNTGLVVLRYTSSKGQQVWNIPRTNTIIPQVQTSPWFDSAAIGSIFTEVDNEALLSLNWTRSGLGHVFMGNKPRISTVEFEVEHNARPETSITSPTGTVTDTVSPTIFFTYSDDEGDPMNAYRTWVEDDNDVVVWDSGWVGSPLPVGSRVGVGLENGDYTFKAQVRQHLYFGESAVASQAITINVPKPDGPDIGTVVLDHDLLTVSIPITGQTLSGLDTSQAIAKVQRRLTVNDPWVDVGVPLELDGSLEGTFVDYHAPIHNTMLYRIWTEYTDPANGFVTKSEYTIESVAALGPASERWCWAIRDAHLGVMAADACLIDVVSPDPWSKKSDEEMASFSSLGRYYPQIVTDKGVRSWTFSLRIEFADKAACDGFLRIRRAQHRMLLSRGQTGEQWFVRIKQDVDIIESNTDPIIYSARFECVEVEDPN